eukprot:scaffold7607_cov104-Isochrysis_galbana.AAC.4
MMRVGMRRDARRRQVGFRLGGGGVGVAAPVLERRLVQRPRQVPLAHVLEPVLAGRQDDGQQRGPEPRQPEEGDGQRVRAKRPHLGGGRLTVELGGHISDSGPQYVRVLFEQLGGRREQRRRRQLAAERQRGQRREKAALVPVRQVVHLWGEVVDRGGGGLRGFTCGEEGGEEGQRQGRGKVSWESGDPGTGQSRRTAGSSQYTNEALPRSNPVGWAWALHGGRAPKGALPSRPRPCPDCQRTLACFRR